MRIGVIGIGMVGGTLGRRWAREGHEVMFGVREPSSEKVGQLLADAGEKARAGTVAEAAAFGDVVVLATPWRGTQDALRSAGDLSGKVLLDCTNPLKADMSGLEAEPSAAEQVASWAPGAKVAKVFNTTGFKNMDNPRYGDDRATMFYCGDDAQAKATVRRVLEQFGWDTADMGGAVAARAIEPLAMLWCIPGFLEDSWGHALKLLREPS